MELMFSVRKLVALDIYAHGYTFILLEFGVGTPVMLLIGLLSIPYGRLFGEYMILLGLNYLPMLAYAIDIKRKNSAAREGASEMPKAREYGVKQLLILVPFAILLLAVYQEITGKNSRYNKS